MSDTEVVPGSDGRGDRPGGNGNDAVRSGDGASVAGPSGSEADDTGVIEARLVDGPPTTASPGGSPAGTTTTEAGPDSAEPPADQPAADQPSIDQPVTDQPSIDQPVTDQPGTDQPVTDQPGTDQPGTDQPVTDQPSTTTTNSPVRASRAKAPAARSVAPRRARVASVKQPVAATAGAPSATASDEAAQAEQGTGEQPNRKGKVQTDAPSGPRKKSGPVTPERPFTLAIDVGGTALKASVLDATGRLAADRMRVETTYPLSPDGLVDALAHLVAPLPSAERVSMGFPGVIRKGTVVTAPHFVTTKGPGTKVSSALVAAWTHFQLEEALEARLHRPVRLLNDADLQGLAVISGVGIELVITLGTGVGSAIFEDGRLAPHLELAQHPLRDNKTYNDELGENALKQIGTKAWRKRVLRALTVLDDLVNYDRCYVGGGNARKLSGHIGERVQVVDNIAGILGGIKLWQDQPAD